MKRTLIVTTSALALWLACASISEAQVFIRAPFVRVWVGGDGGVGVRAPFVNIGGIPGDYPPPYGPRVIYMPPPGAIVQPAPADNTFPPQPKPLTPAPQPAPNANDVPPPPVQAAQTPTLEGFSKTFQAKAGSYEVSVLNPVTKQPTSVRFALPEGTPRRVIVTRDSIEWVYGLRQWVRIEFDKDGAIVTSR
jgi:hypothetical protein